MLVLARNAEIDNYIVSVSRNILHMLLQDKTTGGNILWATDNYLRYGQRYAPDMPISIDLITGEYADLIKPRIMKSRTEQMSRIRDKAEVFTPAWICNAQNNMVDDAWLGYRGAFNVEGKKYWISTREPVRFPLGKTWGDYVNFTCLEPTCGEAPYLVSRYDVVTGEVIDVKDRVGRLDRKLRVINENVGPADRETWTEWVVKAYKSVYGYELQGDSLFVARKNLLYTFVDYYNDRFNENPGVELLAEIADIISWNIWQMDGLKCVVPYSCTDRTVETIRFFGDGDKSTERCPGCDKRSLFRHNGVYCNIMNWEEDRIERFVDGLQKNIY